MRRIAFLFTLIAVGLAAAQDKKDPPKKEAPVVPPREGKSETNHLFNGKNLDGWEGYEDLWSVKDGVIVAQEHRAAQVQHLPADQGQVHRLPPHVRGQAGRVGDALGRRLLGRGQAGRAARTRSKDRTKYTYAGPPRHVPVGLGHVRPVRPQRPAGRRRPGEEGRQAARLERHRDPGPGQPRPRGGQRHGRSWTGATRSRSASRRGRSACSCTRTACRRRSTSRGWSWRRSRRKTSC